MTLARRPNIGFTDERLKKSNGGLPAMRELGVYEALWDDSSSKDM